MKKEKVDMAPITLFTANCREEPHNTVYPNKHMVSSVEEMRDAVSYDQVFAEYENHHRSVDGFICSDCLPFDCDNDHSENEADWKTPEDVENAFPCVPFYAVYSRHHMKAKGKYAPRPRFHVIFPIDPISNSTDYRALKEAVLAHFPYFDTGAKDAARFFFGVKDPVVELHGGDADAVE